ncbi:lasso peptide biosynthesis B2 protein [Amycolatopsis xylanica]|uniref:lasso peptide biosynthesis B2 protein n=1 Tax=Amycolatopsis xylanica TaxID=589385 RepID=UPI00115FDC25|nr:lasso peptide biosynthesis B2 protein [Amycolatopsis xylanica]
MDLLCVPSHVRSGHTANGGTVVLDIRSGCWYSFNDAAQTLWEELCRTGDFDLAVRGMQEGCSTDLRQRIKDDAHGLLADLLDRGLVVKTSKVRPNPTGSSQPTPRSVSAEDLAGRARHRGARTAFVVALVLTMLPFRWALWFVDTGKRRWCRADATEADLARAVVATERAARRYPGRAACLELSLAAVVAACFARRRVDWVIGVADDPYRFHAWAEVKGVAVLNAPDPEFSDYRCVLKR